MDFPNKPVLVDRLALLARSPWYHLVPTILLAAWFLTQDSAHWRVFGGVVCAWIVFEVLVKLYFRARKR